MRGIRIPRFLNGKAGGWRLICGALNLAPHPPNYTLRERFSVCLFHVGSFHRVLKPRAGIDERLWRQPG